jgi:hypothetical protein
MPPMDSTARFESKNELIHWVKANLFDFVEKRLCDANDERIRLGVPNPYRHQTWMSMLGQLKESFDVIAEEGQRVWCFAMQLSFNFDLSMLSALMDIIVDFCHKRAYSLVGSNPPTPGDEPLFVEMLDLFKQFYPHQMILGDDSNIVCRQNASSACA